MKHVRAYDIMLRGNIKMKPERWKDCHYLVRIDGKIVDENGNEWDMRYVGLGQEWQWYDENIRRWRN